jgi:hypothetical protein
MKNWLYTHLPKVTKTTLGPLGVNTQSPMKGSKGYAIPSKWVVVHQYQIVSSVSACI